MRQLRKQPQGHRPVTPERCLADCSALVASWQRGHRLARNKEDGLGMRMQKGDSLPPMALRFTHSRQMARGVRRPLHAPQRSAQHERKDRRMHSNGAEQNGDRGTVGNRIGHRLSPKALPFLMARPSMVSVARSRSPMATGGQAPFRYAAGHRKNHRKTVILAVRASRTGKGFA